MIVENSQSFSVPLIRPQLFTGTVQAIRITSVVAQIAHHLNLVQLGSSTYIWRATDRPSGMPRRNARLLLKCRSCRFGGYRWWAACPRCQRYAAVLLRRRQCRLPYMPSTQISQPSLLECLSAHKPSRSVAGRNRS